MFFDGWYGMGRVVLVGALAYAALVLLLRIAGNRTLSSSTRGAFCPRPCAGPGSLRRRCWPTCETTAWLSAKKWRLSCSRPMARCQSSAAVNSLQTRSAGP